MRHRSWARRHGIPALLLTVAALLPAGGCGRSKTTAPVTPPPAPVLTTPHIAFTRSGTDGFIKLLDPATGQVTSVSPGGAVEQDPAISPDGTRIAFARYDIPGDFYELMTMAVDGSRRQECTSDTSLYDLGPHWSPDGKRLVFTRSRHGSQPWDVYTIRADGDSLRQITTGGDFRALDWSPDGTRILLLRGGRQLLTVAPDGGDPYVLAESTGVVIADAEFSASGNVIVLAVMSSGRSRLDIMNADGSDRRILPDSTKTLGIFRCSWSPDGLAVAFSATQDGSPPHRIMVLRMGESRSQPLFTDPKHYASPDWGPKR